VFEDEYGQKAGGRENTGKEGVGREREREGGRERDQRVCRQIT
jgi:hypothetical protein